MNMPDGSLNNALNALRDYLQGMMRDVIALRETDHHGKQRLGELTTQVEALRHELQGLQQQTPALETLRQELLVALREIDNLHCQRAEQLTTEMETLRQELLAAVREIDNLHCQRADQLTTEMETLRQSLQDAQQNTGSLDALRQEVQSLRQNTPDLDAFREEILNLRQNTPDLDTLRQEVQSLRQNAPDLDTLRQEVQSLRQNTPDLDTLRQEVQGLRHNHSEVERSLRVQQAKAREQLDAHTHELAALTERAETQSHEVGEHIQTLTGLHRQEQSQRETTLEMLNKLNERAAHLEQQMNANQSRADDTLRIDQNRLAALEKWLTTQAEQFGRFDPILRELHGELVSAHQRLAALESTGMAEALEHHEQRLDDAEQHVHDQSTHLDEMQQTLEQLLVQAPAAAKLNKLLMGGLVAAGVIIIALLVILVIS